MPVDDVGKGSSGGKGWWLPLAVPAVAGIFAILVALINRPERPSEPLPRFPAASSLPPSALDERVQAIMTEERCDGDGPSVSAIEDLSITSPAPGAGIDRRTTFRGRATLSSGDHLYFFMYTSDACNYYFEPWGPLAVSRDGSWEVQIDLSLQRIGERWWFHAAIVGSDEHLLLKQVLQHYGAKSPYIRYLPPGARSVHVDAILNS